MYKLENDFKMVHLENVRVFMLKDKKSSELDVVKRLEHVLRVTGIMMEMCESYIEECNKIYDTFTVEFEEKIVKAAFIAALYHDAYKLKDNGGSHGELAARLVETMVEDGYYRLDKYSLEVAAEAIRNHSFKTYDNGTISRYNKVYMKGMFDELKIKRDIAKMLRDADLYDKLTLSSLIVFSKSESVAMITNFTQKLDVIDMYVPMSINVERFTKGKDRLRELIKEVKKDRELMLLL